MVLAVCFYRVQCTWRAIGGSIRIFPVMIHAPGPPCTVIVTCELNSFHTAAAAEILNNTLSILSIVLRCSHWLSALNVFIYIYKGATGP
jgi:hypothetical protein